MQLPRTGQLDDRRRRVLTEEVIGSAGAAVADAAATTSSSRRRSSQVRPYGDDTLTDRQPRVTDLIPQRYGMLALLLLADVAAVAGLLTLHVWMPDLAALTRDGELPAADLQSEGSLARWFSSVVLLLAALTSLVVYSVRRHRKDDYQGRYRVWLWSALICLAASVGEGSKLHEAFRELSVYAVGRWGWGDGSMWWMAACGLALAVVGTRLLLEMRVCRLSTAALLLATACYGMALAARLHWLLPAVGTTAVLVKEGCQLAGNFWLFMAMVLHARFVILEADGRLPIKRVKSSRAEKKTPAQPSGAASGEGGVAKRSWFRKVKVDSAHTSVPAPSKPREASKSVTVTARPETRGRSADDYDYEVDDRHEGHHTRSSSSDDEEGYDDYTSDRRLSKAQRKALRRQKDRHRRGEDL